MNPASINSLDVIFSMNSVWVVTKVFYLIAFLVYIVFAVVIVSQVKQMANTIVTGFEKPLALLSWLHLGGAILALVWALVIL